MGDSALFETVNGEITRAIRPNNDQWMGSGFDERCGSCMPYSRARVVTLMHWFIMQPIQEREVIEEIRYMYVFLTA